MKIQIKIIMIIFVLLTFSETKSQFIQNSSVSLFSDVKAFKVGDALMVLITEDTQAENNASLGNDRSTNLSGDLSAGSGGSFKGSVGLGTGNKFNSQGKASRSESIRSKLSVRVLTVEQNGNLSIEGKRTTKINGETQTITIKGIIRPVDILPNNSVYSYSILDLTLFIDGQGSVSETQEPGLITKFLRILF
jgi:flagellar L-ring protein precursor FlgH